jgi:hypothetical protein
MPMRVVSGKFKLMRVGLCTGILRLRVSMDAFSSKVKRMF